MLKVVLVVGGAILAGCAENTNGQTIPVSLKPDANLAVIKSYRDTPILTTFGRKLTSEIADGVKCTLENDDFSAKVITPAKVSLPIYDKKHSSLSVKCEGFNERRFLLIHPGIEGRVVGGPDRKSTRLNSSHTVTSYAVFCLKKKTD